MKYVIRLHRRIFKQDDNSFSVFEVREHPSRGKLGGWTIATFMHGPKNMAQSYLVEAEWVEHDKYGTQLRISNWEPYKHEDARETLTVKLTAEQFVNDAGTFAKYAAEIDGTTETVVCFEPVELGTYRAFGEWQESPKYGRSFKANKFNAVDWLDMQAPQSTTTPNQPDFNDDLNF